MKFNRKVLCVNGLYFEKDFRSAKRVRNAVVEIIEFSEKESNALASLASFSPEVLPKASLEKAVWGDQVVTDSSIRKLISTLRKKLSDDNDEFLRNVRSKGYTLKVEKKDLPLSLWLLPSYFATVIKYTPYVMVVLALMCLLYIALFFNRGDNAVTYESIYEDNSTFRHYAKHGENYYVLGFDQKLSTIHAISPESTSIAYSSPELGVPITSFSIGDSGTSTVQLRTATTCEILVFKDLFKQQVDSIPCLPKNSYITVDWLTEDTFAFTYMASAESSARIYKYDLNTKTAIPLQNLAVDYGTTNGYGDYYFEFWRDYVVSLRMVEGGRRNIVLSDEESTRVVYVPKGAPLTFTISDDTLLFFNEQNELVGLDLNKFLLSGTVEPTIYLEGQALDAFIPKTINGELHFYVGQGLKIDLFVEDVKGVVRKVYSGSGKFLDFTSSGQKLYGLTKDGQAYNFMSIDGSSIYNSEVIVSDITLSDIAVVGSVLFAGGSGGLFQVQEDSFIPMYEGTVVEMGSFDGKLIVEFGASLQSGLDSKIIVMDADGEELQIHSSADGLVIGDNGYIYRDKISNEVVNHEGAVLGKNDDNKGLYWVDGVYVSISHEKGESALLTFPEGELLKKLEKTVLDYRLRSHQGSTYFLSSERPYNRLIKVENSKWP